MKHILLAILYITVTLSAVGQSDKKNITHDDILKWNRITEKVISNNGSYIAYTISPWKGDKTLYLKTKKGEEIQQSKCGEKPEFTNNSKFLIFTIKPAEQKVRELKLKKTKKENLPKNKLGIYNISENRIDTVHKLKSYKLSYSSGYIAWQEETKKEKKKKNSNDTTENNKEKKDKKKIKSENKKNGYELKIKNLETSNIKSFPFVTDYLFSEENDFIGFVSTGNQEDFKPGLYFYDTLNDKLTAIFKGKGSYKQIVINKTGSKIAFLADTISKTEEKRSYDLYFWETDKGTNKIVNNTDNAFSENYALSENGKLYFSDNQKRLYFGTAEIKPEKDTTVLKEDIPVVDVWHWNEPLLQTQQIMNKKRDLKRSLLSVYHFDNKKVIQLEKETHTNIVITNKGNGEYAVASSYLPYAVKSMWEGWPRENDIYIIDMNTGESKQIITALAARPNISPASKYIYWYMNSDSSWYTYNIHSRKEHKITNPKAVQCANELHDTPSLPNAYGTAGWTSDDGSILIYDRFDIWKVDPENKTKPVNITKLGRTKEITFRLIDFNNIQNRRKARKLKQKYYESSIDVSKFLFLKGHNIKSRAESYSSLEIKSGKIKTFFEGDYLLSTPLKADNVDIFTYTKENFETFPNLIITDKNFKKHLKISNANPQQKDFIWGTAEIYSWTSLDGKKLEGILCKPADFDPNKKYPMIVNFYEKSSQRSNSHRIPQPNRSTVDYHYYTGNGYVIFNPDIYYKEGYPGEDAFNCVIPGITALINEGFIDKKCIGAQGHSWGGYQVAFLATRTNIFAAIESGAPVVNMFSAYGGIRWNTGLNRSFQYEHGQSRIGKNIWEAPQRYIENSPLFTMDKVQTPILIMHNDKDGYVPWYQGIEYFIALRRLEKPAWLLNYNGSDHWPLKINERHDFQIRMAQFFDHYLKGEPMPKWMKEGIPAVKKGIELRYETE